MASTQLGAPDLAANQANAHTTVNEQVGYLDAHVHLAVINRTTTTPPGSPTTGDRYLIAASPTGAWTGQAGSVAVYINGGWKFSTPKEGWWLWDNATDKMFRYTGSAWKEVAIEAVHSKTISILNPSTSENLTVLYAENALTITKLVAISRGTTPSRTWTLRKASDRSAAGTEVVTGGTVTTATTTAQTVTTFNSASIPAGNFLWFTTTAGSGTVTELSITIEYTED